MSEAADCSVCGHPARDEIERRILSGEPLKAILDDYSTPMAYHEPEFIGDREWHEHQSLALAYHKKVCMDGKKWPYPPADLSTCRYCHALQRTESRFKKWGETANTKVKNIHFHYAEKTKGPYFIHDLDHSGCTDCTFICGKDNLKYIGESFPGLQAAIEQRNKRHPLYSSGDGNRGRIPDQHRLIWCDVGKWGYNKRLPAYTEESTEEFILNIKKELKLNDDDREYIAYYAGLKGRIKNGAKTALYEHVAPDYYKYRAIRRKYRIYYRFSRGTIKSKVTLPENLLTWFNRPNREIKKNSNPPEELPVEIRKRKLPRVEKGEKINGFDKPLYSIEGIYERSKKNLIRPKQPVEDEEEHEIEAVDNPGGILERIKELDPGNYDIGNRIIEQEQEGASYDEDETPQEYGTYINQMPYQNGERIPGTPSRTARDGSSDHSLGKCRICGGILSWAGFCNECGAQIITNKIRKCLKNGTLVNQNGSGLCVPFNEKEYERQREEWRALLRAFYQDNPHADKAPDKKLIGYVKHERLTLPDPIERMEKAQVRRLQVFRVLAKMLADFEESGYTPRDIIKDVDKSYDYRRKFATIFYEWYQKPFGYKKMKSDDVHAKMEMAQKHITKMERKNRQQQPRRTIENNFGKFIK